MRENERIAITEIGPLMQWMRSRSGDIRSIQFIDGLDTASVDINGNARIPTPNARMTVRDRIRLRFWFLHETGHWRYQRSAFKIIKDVGLNMNHPLGAIYNILLDCHNETCCAYEFPGDMKALSEGGAVVGRDLLDRLSAKGFTNVTNDVILVSAVLKASSDAEAAWNIGLRISLDKVWAYYPKEIFSLAQELEDRFSFSTRLVDTVGETPESLWQLSKEVYEYLFGKNADEEMDNERNKKKGKGEPDEGEGGELPSSEVPGEGEEVQENSDEEVTINVADLVRSTHFEEDAGGIRVRVDYTGYEPTRSFTPCPPDEFSVFDFEV